MGILAWASLHISKVAADLNNLGVHTSSRFFSIQTYVVLHSEPTVTRPEEFGDDLGSLVRGAL